MEVKRIKKLILLLLAVCMLTACGDKGDQGKEDEEHEVYAIVPNAYFIGSDYVAAVPAESKMYFSRLDVAPEGGAFIYTYAGFEDVCTSVQSYAELLMNEENGFSSVNGETFRAAKLPDFTAAEGSASFSRPTENEKIVVVRMDWIEGQCMVTISIEDAPVPEEPEAAKKKPTGLSHVGAIEYLEALNPAVLELEGDSMDAYNIYITNGFTYVDGKACLRVEIYAKGEIETNEHRGSYYMSGDAENIYRLYDDGRVVEMNQDQ